MAELRKNSGKKKSTSATKAVFQRLMKNKTAVAGLIIFLILVFMSVFATKLTPYRYDVMNLAEKNQWPSAQHIFGTDNLGRDIFARILYGGRYSMSMGLLAVLAGAVIGVFIGSIAGFFGGWIDNIIMRFLEIFQSIPGTLLTIAISTALGAGFDKTILAMAIGRVPMFARIIRASVLRVRTEEYVEAAEAIGCSIPRRIIRYILPNSLAPVIVSATMGMATSVLMLASLSYIGLGIQPPEPEWGAMLSAARNYMRNYPYQLFFPGIFIALVVLSLNLLGDGLRDALDPKLKD